LQAQYSSGWEGPLKQKSQENTSYQHLPRRASPQERSVVLSAELCLRGCFVDEISIDQPYHVCLSNVYISVTHNLCLSLHYHYNAVVEILSEIS
jgi:hypothetical protein